MIENSVYHGIEKVARKGIIKLKAFKLNENVIIEIIDNGIGLDADELEKLNHKLNGEDKISNEDKDSEARKSIGVQNVNTRIKLFYGQQYGIKIFSKKRCYTKIIVTLPYETNIGGNNF